MCFQSSLEFTRSADRWRHSIRKLDLIAYDGEGAEDQLKKRRRSDRIKAGPNLCFGLIMGTRRYASGSLFNKQGCGSRAVWQFREVTFKPNRISPVVESRGKRCWLLHHGGRGA